jgi:hypothetical protein
LKLKKTAGQILLSGAFAVGSMFIFRDVARASSIVPCSFNREIIYCRVYFGKDWENPEIVWADGKSQIYYGRIGNNNILTDPLGGKWRYLDFEVGRSWSLTNMENGNVIIWNGTYKQFGRYVGL